MPGGKLWLALLDYYCEATNLMEIKLGREHFMGLNKNIVCAKFSILASQISTFLALNFTFVCADVYLFVC